MLAGCFPLVDGVHEGRGGGIFPFLGKEVSDSPTSVGWYIMQVFHSPYLTSVLRLTYLLLGYPKQPRASRTLRGTQVYIAFAQQHKLNKSELALG